MPVHPFSPDWYVGGSVLVPGRANSIVEVTRFQLERFTVSIKELAEWFGLEVTRIICGRMTGSTKELNGAVLPTLPSVAAIHCALSAFRTFAVCFNHGISL